MHERGLHVVALDDRAVTRLAGEDESTVGWGTAEFVAAEEMGRDRGYWWAPDGDALLATRVDEAPVTELWIADVANPRTLLPGAVRYPPAGSAIASVDAYLVPVDGSGRVRVVWDRDANPYLAAGHWDEHGPLIAVQSRDQRRLLVLAVDPVSGETSTVSTQVAEDWIASLIPGLPRPAGGRPSRSLLRRRRRHGRATSSTVSSR